MIATPRIKSIQRWGLGLLVLSGMVNYIDRQTLAVANIFIQQDLELSVGEMGLLLSAFLWAYAFSQLPMGALVDRWGPRLLLAVGMVLWSFAQVLGGTVTTFPQFLGARALLGIGEAPQFPSGARVVRDWFNVSGRGTATGIFNSASSLGSFVAVPVLTFLMLTFSWRWMFIIMGVVGLVVAAVWYAIHREPTQVDLTADETAYLTQGDTNVTRRRVTFADWRQLFGFRTTWGMIAGYFGTIYVTWIYTAWLPYYLEHERHISVGRTGLLAAIPFFWGVVGGLLGGYLVDVLAARGVSPMASRKYPMGISLLGVALFTALTAVAPSNTWALVFISAAMFLAYVSSSTAWAMASVAAPSNCTASIGSIQNFGGYIGGALAPLVTGLIVQSTGSFTMALYLGAAVSLVAAVIYLSLVDKAIVLEGTLETVT